MTFLRQASTFLLRCIIWIGFMIAGTVGIVVAGAILKELGESLTKSFDDERCRPI